MRTPACHSHATALISLTGDRGSIRRNSIIRRRLGPVYYLRAGAERVALLVLHTARFLSREPDLKGHSACVLRPIPRCIPRALSFLHALPARVTQINLHERREQAAMDILVIPADKTYY